MGSLPTGTVTFLFTDIEGSTLLWEQFPRQMAIALERHDHLVRRAIASCEGAVFSAGGDGFAAAFQSAEDAITAAATLQREIGSTDWAGGPSITVRVGLHSGQAQERDGNYFGPAVNRAARVMALGHGGQILVSEVTGRLLDRPDLVDLGLHSVRGFRRPEHVWQLGESVHPPLRGEAGLPGGIPEFLTSFVGRTELMAEIAEAVRGGRLVTLAGAGGVGKTRLACEVARRCASDFPGGQWFVDLAPVRDPDRVVHAVATALDVRTPAVAAIVGALVSSRYLLVVDNCEHVVAACASLLDDLLRASPNIVALATSREPLGIPGERVRRVAPLVTEGGRAEAVELLEDRLVDAGLRRSDLDRATLELICLRLDGLPLAIELAAARIPSLGADLVLRGLDERFRLLTGAPRGASARHGTLNAAVEWSYDLLDEDERRLFERLAVFVGGFDASSVCAVGDDEQDEIDVVALLDRLVQKSMVVAEHHAGRVRYGMLETLRQFAHAKLLFSARLPDLRSRHRAYFEGLARQASTGLTGPEEARWCLRMAEEFENCRAAFDLAVEAGDVDAALRITDDLRWYGSFRFRTEYLAWALEASSLPGVDQSARGPATCATAALMLTQAGRPVEALELIDRGLEDERRLGIQPEISLRMVGSNAARGVSDLERTRELVEDAIALVDPRGEVLDRVRVYGVAAAHILRATGDLERAASLLDVAEHAASALGCPSWNASVPLWRAHLELAAGDPEAARRSSIQALELAEAVSNVIFADRARLDIVLVDIQFGEPEIALRSARDVILRGRRSGALFYALEVINALPLLLQRAGRADDAAELRSATSQQSLPAVDAGIDRQLGAPSDHTRMIVRSPGDLVQRALECIDDALSGAEV